MKNEKRGLRRKWANAQGIPPTMLTIAEIHYILAQLEKKQARQSHALTQTLAELDVWKDLRAAKEKETKK